MDEPSDDDARHSEAPSGSPPSRGLRRRPPGVSDELVEATGKLSEAVEWVERARGRLYDFHQLSGHADLLLGDAATLLERAGARDAAALLRRELVGRNVLEGRWTFQIVEEYDATYWSVARGLRQQVEAELLGGQPHVFEAELKEARRTRGLRHHEATPSATIPPEDASRTR